MAEESLFATGFTPNLTNENDGAPGIWTALSFSSSVPGVVHGVRFYRTTTDGGTYTGKLWQVTAGEEDPGPGAGTQLAAKTFVGSATAGWNEIRFDSPVAVAANTLYKVGRHNSQGRYVALVGGLATSVAVGNLKAWGANESGEWPLLGTVRNGTYEVSDNTVYPNEDSGTPNYGVDVIFEATVEPAEGAAAFGLELALAVTGDAPALPPSEGAAAFGVAAYLAATGETPAAGESTGAAALGIVFTLATSGAAGEVAPSDGYPTLADLRGNRTDGNPGYLGLNSWSDDEISDALAAERAAQARVCAVPTLAYPADLKEALMRRVMRNLALRRVGGLAVLRGDAEAGPTYVPGRDPEVRRFEAAWRRVSVG